MTTTLSGTPDTAPLPLLDDLRGIPLRFWALAVVGSAVALVFALQTDWTPFGYNQDSLQGTAWGDLADDVSTVLLTLVPLVALRLPFLAGLLAYLPFVATAFDGRHSWPFTIFLALVAAAMVALWRSPRAAIALGVAALVPVATTLLTWSVISLPYDFDIVSTSRTGDRWWTAAMFGLAVAAALGIAQLLKRTWWSSQRAAGLEARAADVERESTVLSERARLAHDLHDVVAHHVSLIAVRAETAPYTVPDLSPAAATLMSAIADDSRRALDELRGVLGVLRRSEDPGAGDRAPAPQPGAGDLERLVEEARAAGSPVALEASGLCDVPAATGYVVYRVVQEALTNARRHAPGAPVEVVARAAGDVVEVTVANASPRPLGPAGGGLTGMRERVEALGGTFAVTHVGGQVVVRARL